MGHLYLGQENDIRANAIRVGASRAQLGTMQFGSGLNNPTVKMRNVDGVSAMDLLSVGDNYQTSSGAGVTSTPDNSTGILDLSGGMVDILVSSIRVGRGLGAAGAVSGSGTGTLTWTAGTITSTGSADIGRQTHDNRANAAGVVNVCSNAVWYGNNIRIGRDAGTAQSGTGNGTLNILYGGQVTITNDIAEDILGDGTSTINLTNGALTVGGVITVDTVNVHSGDVYNTGLITVSSLLTGAGAIHGPVTVASTGTLAPGNGIGTLTIWNDLTNNGTCRFDLNTDTLACDKVTMSGTVTYGGTLEIAMSGSGTALIPGAVFQLFNAGARSGAFDAIVPATPGAGLAWDTSQLTVDGTLKITAATPPSPTIGPVTVAGTNLVVSAPTVTGANYVLQSATNLTPTIFWVNESTNAGTGDNLILNVPIQPGKPQKFVRFWVY
jgi:hypothetical protein